jgi:biofilm PGA synthesis N-glycosyltransferase PgaC
MEIIKIVTWLSIFLVFYSYFGYALLVWVFINVRKKNQHRIVDENAGFEPPVSLIVAVYNEEDVLKKKIENCLEIDYPKNKLKLIFVADGSTDNSAAIIKQYPQIELLYKPERQGKVAAINRTMTTVSTDYVIFCDANTFLNKDCIKEIIKHYRNEKIGAVAGEKKVVVPATLNKPVKDGEGLYWKYESKLKKIDSDFYSVVGAAGELFSIRTKLFEPVPSEVLLDDFIISMNICKKGYRVIYEPKAYAMEAPSLTMKDEQKRKIRISAGGFQSVIMLKGLLNIFKYGKLSFLYISHRVSRWILCPVLLPLIFVCNIIIVQFSGDNVFNIYTALLIAQIAFYSMAALGWLFSLKNIKNNIFYVPFYFVFINVALYIGFVRFLNNKQTVLWDKAKRK